MNDKSSSDKHNHVRYREWNARWVIIKRGISIIPKAGGNNCIVTIQQYYCEWYSVYTEYYRNAEYISTASNDYFECKRMAKWLMTLTQFFSIFFLQHMKIFALIWEGFFNPLAIFCIGWNYNIDKLHINLQKMLETRFI